MKKIALALTIPLVMLLLTASVSADPGGASGWYGNCDLLTADDFSPSITPPAGEQMLLCSNGPGDSPAGDNPPNNDQTEAWWWFYGKHACFSWSWLTSECETCGDHPYDDVFWVTLDNAAILWGSVDGTNASPLFPNIPTNDVYYEVVGPGTNGSTNGSGFYQGRSPWYKYCRHDLEPRWHVMEIAVADRGNHLVDSGLLIALDP